MASALDPISSRPDSWLRFDQRILLLALAAGFPAAFVALILLWTGDYTPKVQWTLTVFIVGVWSTCSFSVARTASCCRCRRCRTCWRHCARATSPIRARGASGDDPLGAVMLEVNVLAETLHDQRLGALEAGALLRTVMVEIDVAVFTFDGAHALRLVNRAGERLLAQPAEQLLGRTADELGLARVPRRRRRLASRTSRSRAASAAGKCAARRSARADGRISCWCSPTSAVRCATRSGRRGSG